MTRRITSARVREGAAAGLRPARIAGGAVLLMSVVVLTGWVLRIRLLASLYPGVVTMKANTALALGIAAIGLLYRALDPPHAPRRQALLAALACIVAGIGWVTLAEYAFKWNPGFDQWLVGAGDEVGLSATPGRMAAITAAGFALLGVGIAPLPWLGRREVHLVQASLALVAAMGLSSLLAYIYGAIPLRGLGQGIQIAPHTALAFVLLSGGLLACGTDHGLLATVLSPRAGGVLARRLLPVAFIVPVVLGALRQLTGRAAVTSILASGSTLAVTTMLAFGVIIWRTAATLNHADAAWQAGERERSTLQLREELAQARAETDQRALRASEAARAQAEHSAREMEAAYAASRSAMAIAEREREAVERAVREREDAMVMLDRVMESTTIGIAVFDTELRCIRANSAFAMVIGQAVAPSGTQVITDLDAGRGDGLETPLRTVLAKGEPILNVERMTEPTDGSAQRRTLLSSFYPLRSENGVLFGAGVTVQDTTQQKALEQQLRQSQKMEAVGQLAGGVAHDFNNLLTVISGYSHILLAEDGLDAALVDHVQQIGDAANRAAELTRQLLAFSRQQMMQPQVIDLDVLTARLDRMLRRLLRADIVMETDLAGNLDRVVADPGQLEQVIMNLVVNARDAMPHGGRLTISTAMSREEAAHAGPAAGSSAGSSVVLTVRDTGTGMDDATIAQIFDPFFTTKPKGEGTGLGLSTVYGIVRQAGGHITVSSVVGKGTEFRIALPATTEPVPQPAPAAGPATPAAASGVILLAEDEAPVRKVTTRILERAGYTVLGAESGPQAIEIARSTGVPIDLLMTDMVMPHMSGQALAATFHSLHPNTPTLYMSGYTESTIARADLLHEHASFIQKPFSPQALLAKVREAMGAA